jgi:hypothetical protein
VHYPDDDVILLPNAGLAFEIADARAALASLDGDVPRALAHVLGGLQHAVWKGWHPPMVDVMRPSLALLVVRAVNAGQVWR